MPLRIVTPQAGGGTGIGSKAQIHERWRSPIGPITRLACGPDEAPQPSHGRSGQGFIVIPRTGDYGNHYMPGYAPPVFPAVELGEIVRSHDPDKPPFRIASDQLFQRFHGVARAQVALDSGRPNPCTPRHFPGRFQPRLQRRHIPGALFQRVAGRNQPPDLVQPECIEREQADPSMSAMGRVERTAKETGRFQDADCSVPGASKGQRNHVPAA